MNITEEMVKEIILEVLQQMQGEGRSKSGKERTFRLCSSEKLGRQNPERIETR